MEESRKIIRLRKLAQELSLRTGEERNRPVYMGKKKKKKKKKPPIRLPKTYAELLKDPRWAKKRKHIMQRDHFRCKNCDSKNHLCVHHLKYIGNPWDCPDEFLITLCETRHNAIHEKNNP